MPIVVREGAKKTILHASSQLVEGPRATIEAMRSTAAECRHLVEVTRSTIADTLTAIREVDALLQAAMFQFELIALCSVISRLSAAKLSKVHAN